jgi:hypothetical protein
MITKQNISSSSVVHIYSAGVILNTFCLESRAAFPLLRVERNSFLFLIMYPFSVTIDTGRCLLIRSHVNPGHVINTLGWFLTAFKNLDLVEDPMAR